MDFNQVRYFLALADSLNFTRAAERCSVSQPALTQAIRRLEEELGGALIVRSGQDSRLTPLGGALRGHFEEIDRTRSLVQSTADALLQGEVAELNVGVMCTIGPRLLGRMLDSFQMAHPSVSFVLHDVTPNVIEELLLSGALDGVFCSRRGAPHPLVEYTVLFDEALVVAFAAGHAFEEREAVPLCELANERYLDRLHCEFRKRVLEIYQQQGLNLNVAVRSQREDWIQSLIRNNNGVTALPRYSLLEPELLSRPICDPEMSRTVELAIRKSDNNAALLALQAHAAVFAWPKP